MEDTGLGSPAAGRGDKPDKRDGDILSFHNCFSSDLQHHGEVEGVRAGHHGHIAPGPLVSLHRKVT